jgi:RimJ/RimL family protein N-acetyltransferase
MGPVELRADGLLLRQWRTEDVDEIFRACQDPLIQRWTGVPSPYEREHAEGYVRQSPLDWAEGVRAPIGVFDEATGEMLGSSGLVRLDLAAGTGEIGYWTAPWARGRGVALAAARAVVRWAQDDLGLHRLLWRAEVGNHASRLVAARLGVHFEGVARGMIPGGADAWVGALLPGELRDGPDDEMLTRVALRSRVFWEPQPTVPAGPVRLRALREDDMASIEAAAGDPETVRYTRIPHPYTPDDARQFVCDFAPGQWRLGVAGIFAVADADDALVGTMDLRLEGDELTTDVADVGYMMAPWARRRGYTSAALRALCDWGFAELGLRRIEWQAFVGNEASRGVALKAGFTMEGIARAGLAQRGTFADVWVGARLRGDVRIVAKNERGADRPSLNQALRED